ncbi:hypothetical protein V2W45_1304888 [Cenococcum geophilum]
MLFYSLTTVFLFGLSLWGDLAEAIPRRKTSATTVSASADQFTTTSGVTGATADPNTTGAMGLNVLLHGDGGQPFFDFPNQAVQANLVGVMILAPDLNLFWGGGSGLQRTDGVAYSQAVNDLILNELPTYLYAHQGAVAGVISAVVDSKILLKELGSEGGKIDAQALDIPQELLQAALPSLEHIALSLNEPTWIYKARGTASTITRPDGWEDWIPGFFKHAHNLQRLDLSFPALLEHSASPRLGFFGNVRHTADPEWFNGLKSIGFPSLTHLVLRQFRAGEQDLVEFIRRQSSTLTSLTLMELTLASGGWGTLLISLGNDCNLDELIIHDPWVGLMGDESVRQHSHFKNAAKKVVVIAVGEAQVWPLDTGQAPIGTSFAKDSTTIVGLG